MLLIKSGGGNRWVASLFISSVLESLLMVNSPTTGIFSLMNSRWKEFARKRFWDARIGNRMVANERLTVRPAVNFQDHSNPKPIILEVGTFGHILLTDTFQLPTDYYATVTWWRLLLTNTFNRQSGPWLLQDLQQQPCNAFEDWRSVERLVVDGLGGYSLITFPLRITAGETILCPHFRGPHLKFIWKQTSGLERWVMIVNERWVQRCDWLHRRWTNLWHLWSRPTVCPQHYDWDFYRINLQS